MYKSIFILGPTAVGKTDLAFYLSKKIPSILISADSVQVYRGADIISGKDKSIPTELLDVFPPTQSFSVRDFVEQVGIILEKKDEQKIPIIVGGTGFYLDSLFGKNETINIPPDEKLRRELEKLSVAELQKKLKEVNPERLASMNNSDQNNPRRLIRAIEIVKEGCIIDYTPPVFNENEVVMIGLKTSVDVLKKRIETRVDKRIKEGALLEAEVLFQNYSNLSPQLKSASGYKEMFDYLQGLTTLEEAVERWKLSDVQLAKRQMTWFQKRKNIEWFDIDNKNFKHEIVDYLNKNGLNVSVD